MLNDIFNNNEIKEKQLDHGYYLAKELFGANRPFIKESGLHGPTVIFNDHFIVTMREALSTGCIAKMNVAEEDLFFQFVESQDGRLNRDISTDAVGVLAALNQWLIDELQCLDHPVVNGCFDQPEHTWQKCSTYK